jgi:hypothetical protein
VPPDPGRYRCYPAAGSGLPLVAGGWIGCTAGVRGTTGAVGPAVAAAFSRARNEPSSGRIGLVV